MVSTLKTRTDLHECLLDILVSLGVRERDGDGRLYFQPTTGVQMKYPAIVYRRDRIENRFADNQVYIQTDQYQITVVDKDPDSELVRRVSLLPRCTHVRHFTADNLNHDIFTLRI